MQTPTKASHSIYHKIVDIFFLLAGIFILWFFNFDDSLRPALIASANIDMVMLAILMLVFIAKNGLSGIHLLTICTSYNIHSISAGFVEGYEILYIFSWLTNACLLIVRPELISFSIIYHLGLSFEPSMTRTTGLGMQMGFYCSNQTILLLAACIDTILKNGLKACFDGRHLLVIFAGLFLLNQHSFSVQAGFTSEVVLFFATLILFLSTTKKDNEKEEYLWIAFIAGSAIVFLAAVLNLLIISEGISELLRRRAMAANIHPNRLATFALASIWLFNWCKSLKPSFSTLLVYIINLALLLLIILTGARIILALTLFSFALYYFFNKKVQIGLKVKVLATAVFAISFLRIFLHFRWTELVKNERLTIWYSGWQNFLNAIWTGHGAMSFAYLPQYYQPESTFWLYDWNYPHVHQLFLELLNWGGVPLLAAFVYVWIKAFLSNKNLEFRTGLFCLTLSGFLDFAWGTASMLTVAALFLFKTSQDKSGKLQPKGFTSPLKFVSVTLLGLAMLATLRLEMGRFFLAAAQSDFYRQGQNWKKYINSACQILKNDPAPAMHSILWHHTTGTPAEKLMVKSKNLTLSFPQYYAVWFLHGRLLELNHNFAEANNCFARSLTLEPRDLTGIRNARYLLTKLKTSQQQLNSEEILPLLKRGHFGLPMLLFHPLYGETFTKKARQAVKIALADATQPDIDKFFLLANMAEWGILPDLEAIDSLLETDLPAWAQDELRAARLQASGATQQELVNLLQNNPGPALARQIAALFLEKEMAEKAIEAYRQHRKAYNMRNKNYEDLAAQFIAARAYYRAGHYGEAFFELERIGAYDQMNPFVAELRAKVHAARQQKEPAQYWLNLAMKLVNNARGLPFYKESANDFTWPEGDHWTLVSEKTMRAHDRETFSYCAAKWQSFRQRLAELGQKMK
jgi:O-antigen ligase